MSTEEPPRLMIVSKQQLSKGYEVLRGMVARNYPFDVLHANDDGTYEVVNPHWALWNKQFWKDRTNP